MPDYALINQLLYEGKAKEVQRLVQEAVDEGNRPANGLFKYGPRECEIRWSSYVLGDAPRLERIHPHYCVVQINNVFNSPIQRGDERWVAFPHPQVMFKYYDAFTGELRYTESIVAGLSN